MIVVSIKRPFHCKFCLVIMSTNGESISMVEYRQRVARQAFV